MAYGSSPPPSKPKKKTASGKLSDKQKQTLNDHMAKHKDLKDLTPSQLKSHRMKMMSRMRKGMSIAQAHKDIMK